jgi:HAD superfamily hydrolase (TIGR01450 family)
LCFGPNIAIIINVCDCHYLTANKEEATVTTFLLDLEGTLVTGKSFEPIPGVSEVLSAASSAGHSLAVLTNNTTHSPEDIQHLVTQSIARAGTALTVVSPIALLSDLVTQRKPRVLAIGSDLLRTTVTNAGGICVEDDNSDLVVLGGGANADENILSVAVRAILDYDAELVALHVNKLYVDEQGRRTFGVGGLAAGLEYCCGVKATVLGKPSPTMYLAALPAGVKPTDDVIMISDDFHSDLGGAKKLGIKTAFVATGKYSLADLDASGINVDYKAASLSELWAALMNMDGSTTAKANQAIAR